MLEVFKNEELGICGCMKLEGEDVVIYSNPTTGDFLYWDEASGRNMLIGGISDRTAKLTMQPSVIYDALLKGSYGEEAMGVIFCNKYILVLTSEESCEMRPYSAMKIPSDKKFEIVLSIDAE